MTTPSPPTQEELRAQMLQEWSAASVAAGIAIPLYFRNARVSTRGSNVRLRGPGTDKNIGERVFWDSNFHVLDSRPPANIPPRLVDQISMPYYGPSCKHLGKTFRIRFQDQAFYVDKTRIPVNVRLPDALLGPLFMSDVPASVLPASFPFDFAPDGFPYPFVLALGSPSGPVIR